MVGSIRRVCCNVKRWQDASMALRWTSAAMLEAAKGFRWLKGYKQLSALQTALAAQQTKHAANSAVEPAAKPDNLITRQFLPRKFQQRPGHPLRNGSAE
jgi:putative transposase